MQPVYHTSRRLLRILVSIRSVGNSLCAAALGPFCSVGGMAELWGSLKRRAHSQTMSRSELPMKPHTPRVVSEPSAVIQILDHKTELAEEWLSAIGGRYAGPGGKGGLGRESLENHVFVSFLPYKLKRLVKI